MGLYRRAALALAIGCIIRSKGGIALQSTLTLVADTFLAVAAVCTGPVQLWLLHGLWLTANAAGPAFLPHVKASTVATPCAVVVFCIRQRFIACL